MALNESGLANVTPLQAGKLNPESVSSGNSRPFGAGRSKWLGANSSDKLVLPEESFVRFPGWSIRNKPLSLRLKDFLASLF